MKNSTRRAFVAGLAVMFTGAMSLHALAQDHDRPTISGGKLNQAIDKLIKDVFAIKMEGSIEYTDKEKERIVKELTKDLQRSVSAKYAIRDC